MELPEASAEVSRRLNITYGIESSDPNVVHEVLGTGEHMAEAARQLKIKPPESNLDHLYKRLGQTRQIESALTIPTDFKTAKEQLDSIAEQLSGLETEFAEVCAGKENLIKLAINASENSLSQSELEELEKLSDAELSRLFDEREMAELLRSCRDQLNKLETEPIISKLPALSENSQVICTGLEGLRKKLIALKAGEDFALQQPPEISPSQPDVDVANIGCRLAELERIVGIEAASRLKYSFTDLPTALCQVTHQLMLLDPKKVDAIHERTSALAGEHERLAGVLAGYGEFEKKIELLYANLSKWISLSRSLPRVSNRLKLIGASAIVVDCPIPVTKGKHLPFQIIRKLECCANLSREVSTIDGRINSELSSQMV